MQMGICATIKRIPSSMLYYMLYKAVVNTQMSGNAPQTDIWGGNGVGVHVKCDRGEHKMVIPGTQYSFLLLLGFRPRLSLVMCPPQGLLEPVDEPLIA